MVAFRGQLRKPIFSVLPTPRELRLTSGTQGRNPNPVIQHEAEDRGLAGVWGNCVELVLGKVSLLQPGFGVLSSPKCKHPLLCLARLSQVLLPLLNLNFYFTPYFPIRLSPYLTDP